MFENQISILEWFLISWDTEDWSNGWWKFSFAITGINYILKYNKIQNSYFTFELYHYIATVFTVFLDQIQASVVSIRDFFQEHKNLTHSIFWMVIWICFTLFFTFKPHLRKHNPSSYQSGSLEPPSRSIQEVPSPPQQQRVLLQLQEAPPAPSDPG